MDDIIKPSDEQMAARYKRIEDIWGEDFADMVSYLVDMFFDPLIHFDEDAFRLAYEHCMEREI